VANIKEEATSTISIRMPVARMISTRDEYDINDDAGGVDVSRRDEYHVGEDAGGVNDIKTRRKWLDEQL